MKELAAQERAKLAEPHRLRRMELSYEIAILAALGLIVAVVSLVAPRFLQPDNLFQVARNFSFIARP